MLVTDNNNFLTDPALDWTQYWDTNNDRIYPK